MKTVLATVLTMIAFFSISSAYACTQEAQFIGKVHTKTMTAKGCVITINAKDLEQFNPSYVCPLVPGEALDTPIVIERNKDYYCDLDAGDFISGILIKAEDQVLTIE